MPIAFESIATLSQALKNGEVSSRQLVEQAVARIDSLNPQLNAVVCLEAEQALANADQADARRAPTRMPLSSYFWHRESRDTNAF